jgi:hypothetical protein
MLGGYLEFQRDLAYLENQKERVRLESEEDSRRPIGATAPIDSREIGNLAGANSPMMRLMWDLCMTATRASRTKLNCQRFGLGWMGAGIPLADEPCTNVFFLETDPSPA